VRRARQRPELRPALRLTNQAEAGRHDAVAVAVRRGDLRQQVFQALNACATGFYRRGKGLEFRGGFVDNIRARVYLAAAARVCEETRAARSHSRRHGNAPTTSETGTRLR